MGVYDERRVKIVATLGPASRSPETLRELFEAGLDVVRINAAHGSPEERARLVEDVRNVSEEAGRLVPILFDLRGLKIRTGPVLGEEKVGFARGGTVEVVNTPVPTTPERIGIDYPQLFEVIQPGSRVLISDGLIELLVEKIEDNVATCQVGRGGHIPGRQGVTLPGAMIKGGALTEVDREDLRWGVEQGVDFIGLSFVTDAADLRFAREVASWYGSRPPALIAKIERPDALDNVRGIAAGADGLMVARGDLGVQMPPERVPRAQKDIIKVANGFAIPVITATQMLESMITQPVATRAETSDVANAVWDGTDAVMLSAETAIGQYPVEAVRTMGRIIREAERDGPIRTSASLQPLPDQSEATLVIADAIARAARELADEAPVEHIVVFTLTGASVRRVAKYRPKPALIGAAADIEIARRLNLVWGTRGTAVPVEENPDHLFRVAGKKIIEEGLATEGEFALIAGSLPMTHVSGRTNMLHVRRLGT
ncbi:MAG TPA: pyruvate kinase [Thermomicrobiales bacterium]|nr:pyruvate kinase [Thermomicrobiales bacterium]